MRHSNPKNSASSVLDEASCKEMIINAQKEGLSVVMTNGCFDLLHAGHVSYLEQSKALGDLLIVAVNSDESVRRLKGPTRPICKLADRMALLAAIHCIDGVVSFDEDTPERLYCSLLPDILSKGGDYSATDVAGGECVKNNGGRVEIIAFLEGHSTSSIVEKIKGAE